MNWRDDSTATNVSLLSMWVYGVIRPLVRIMRSAGVSEASLLDSVKRASREHDGEAKKGRLGSGSRYESLLALASVTAAWARSAAWTDEAGQPRELALREDGPKGFAGLVRSINPRLNPTAVIQELQSMDVVRILPGGERGTPAAANRPQLERGHLLRRTGAAGSATVRRNHGTSCV